MKFSINFRHTEGSSEVIDYIDRRLSFSFSRIRHKVENIAISLADINSPKGGIDKRCHIIVKAVGLNQLIVVDKRTNLYEAIDSCIDRASLYIKRKLARKLAPLRRMPTKPFIPFKAKQLEL